MVQGGLGVSSVVSRFGTQLLFQFPIADSRANVVIQHLKDDGAAHNRNQQREASQNGGEQ